MPSRATAIRDRGRAPSAHVLFSLKQVGAATQAGFASKVILSRGGIATLLQGHSVTTGAVSQGVGPWKKERRRSCRYEIPSLVEYRLIQGKEVVESGIGQMVDMCSGGIRFRSSRTLPVGKEVRLSVDWPVRLNQVVPLRLCVTGRIIRSEGNEAVAKIKKYEYRTRPIVKQ